MKTTLRLKLSIVLFLILVKFNTSNAQEKTFQKEESYLWLGHGLINLDFKDYNFYGNEIESSYTLGALFMKYEYAIGDKSGLGLTINYLQSSRYISNPYDLYTIERNYNSIGFIFRYNNHFYADKIWDVYWGIGAGYKFYASESTTTEFDPVIVHTDNYSGTKFTMELSIGTRLKLSEGFCIYSEFGATKSLFQLGMTFKI
jgi:hypothetical protein